MTGPVEPSRPEQEPEDRPDDPRPAGSGEPARPQPTPYVSPTRPAATGWPGRPEAPRPGSIPTTPAGPPRGPQPGPSTPAGGWTTRPVTPPGPSARPEQRDQPRPDATEERPEERPEPRTEAPRPVAGPTSAPPLRTEAPPPVRPPVPTGVPPRPSPLPPPRTTGSAPRAAAATGVAGSLGTTTVVPENPRRPAPRPVNRTSAGARGRRAKLAVKRVDPWSVFVTSLVLSLMLAISTIVAAFVLYLLLDALGVPSSINDELKPFTDNDHLLTKGTFVGIAALIAAANVVLLTLLATIGAMLYNLVSTFTGGLELTLAERD